MFYWLVSLKIRILDNTDVTAVAEKKTNKINSVCDCEYMKIIHVNCGLRNEYVGDLRSN